MVLPSSPPTKRIKLESSPEVIEIDRPSDDIEIEGEHCTICLQPVVDRTVIPTCSHEFCFECLALWAEQSRRCPLCSQSIGGYLIHHIRSKYDYQKHYLTPLRTSPPPLRPISGRTSQAPANRRHSRRERRWGRREREEREHADALDRAISRRRWIYDHDLYAKHVASNSYTRYRPYPSPAQFSASPDLIARATMFLRRELRVWPNLDVEFLTTFVLSLMKSIDIRSESAVKLLAEFLDMDAPYTDGSRHVNAEHFAHEIYSYIRSPYRNLAVYDTVVQYDVPSHIPPPPTYERSRRWEPEPMSRSPSPSPSHPRSRSSSPSSSHSSHSPPRRTAERDARPPIRASRSDQRRSRSRIRRDASKDLGISRLTSPHHRDSELRHQFEKGWAPPRPSDVNKGKRPLRYAGPERDATPTAEQYIESKDPVVPAAGPSRLHAGDRYTHTTQEKSILSHTHEDTDTLEPDNAGRKPALLPDSSRIEFKDEGTGSRRKSRTRNLLDSIHAHLRPSSTASGVVNRNRRGHDVGSKDSIAIDVEEGMSTLPANGETFASANETTSGQLSLLSRISMTPDVATPTTEDDGARAQTVSDDRSSEGLLRMSAPQIMARTRARLAERKTTQMQTGAIPPHDDSSNATLSYVAAPSTSPSSSASSATMPDLRALLLSRLETERRLTGTREGDNDEGTTSGHVVTASDIGTAVSPASPVPMAQAASESERVEAKLRAQARVRVRLAAARRTIGAQDASSGALTPKYGTRDRDGKGEEEGRGAVNGVEVAEVRSQPGEEHTGREGMLRERLRRRVT